MSFWKNVSQLLHNTINYLAFRTWTWKNYAYNREHETQPNALAFGSSMAERQRFGCLDIWPCICKQIVSLRFSILNADHINNRNQKDFLLTYYSRYRFGLFKKLLEHLVLFYIFGFKWALKRFLIKYVSDDFE